MDVNPHWSDLGALPPKQGQGWSILVKRRAKDLGFAEISRQVGRWHQGTPLLVGSPQASRFHPPVLVPELEKLALHSVRAHVLNFASVSAVVGAMLAGITAGHPRSGAFALGMLTVYLAAIFWADYLLALRHRDGVAERALFFYWLRCRSPAGLAMRCWTAFAVFIGTLQLSMQILLGGQAEVFDAVGVIYPFVESGELWRLLTGPYLHYSLLHYGTNLAGLALFGSLAFAFFGRSTVALFVVANIVSAWAQMTFGGRVFDNFGGMSGGVYALVGAVVVAGLVNRRLLPKAGWLLFTNLVVLGLLSSELLSETTASVAHFSGLALGGLAGLVYGWQGRRPAAQRS